MDAETEVVFNIHSWKHLMNDVEVFGFLDNFSLFPFKYFAQVIPPATAPTNKVAERICCHVKERAWGLVCNVLLFHIAYVVRRRASRLWFS